MKRIISVLAAAVMLITMLGGCGKKPAQDNDSEQTSNSQDENSQTIQNQEEGESSGDNKNTAKDNQSDGSNSQTAGKADSSDKTQDSGKVTSDNNTQNGDGNGNNGDGTHTGDGAPSDNYAPPVTNTDDPGDIDPDEIGHFESDGEIDTRYEGKNDNLPYIDKASTTVSDFEITADSYDEKKLTLPIMKIVTGNGKDITSKTEYTGATVSISNTLKNYSLGNTVVDYADAAIPHGSFLTKRL